MDLLEDVDIGGLLPGVLLGVENVDPYLLVGILDGVPSSLISDRVEPALDTGLDAGLDELGVKLDLSGIDVFVVSVLEGVRRPYDAESD